MKAGALARALSGRSSLASQCLQWSEAALSPCLLRRWAALHHCRTAHPLLDRRVRSYPVFSRLGAQVLLSTAFAAEFTSAAAPRTVLQAARPREPQMRVTASSLRTMFRLLPAPKRTYPRIGSSLECRQSNVRFRSKADNDRYAPGKKGHRGFEASNVSLPLSSGYQRRRASPEGLANSAACRCMVGLAGGRRS
jgi:hypothetical protein